MHWCVEAHQNPSINTTASVLDYAKEMMKPTATAAGRSNVKGAGHGSAMSSTHYLIIK